MVDNIKLLYKEPLIVNTDVSSSPGIHWIVLHLINKHVLFFIFFRSYDKIMIVKINNSNL